MRKWIVASLASFTLLTGLACEAEGPSKEKTEAVPCPSDRVPKDKESMQQKRYVVIYGCAEEDMGPLDLSIWVRDNTTGETRDHSEISAGGEIQYVIGYDAGHKVELVVELKPSKPGSKKGFLYLSDGVGNRKFYYIASGRRAKTDPTFFTTR